MMRKQACNLLHEKGFLGEEHFGLWGEICASWLRKARFFLFAEPGSWRYVAFQELLLPPSGKARLSQEQWGVEAAAFPLGRPALLPQRLEELALPLVRVPHQAGGLRGAAGPCFSLGLGQQRGQAMLWEPALMQSPATG